MIFVPARGRDGGARSNRHDVLLGVLRAEENAPELEAGPDAAAREPSGVARRRAVVELPARYFDDYDAALDTLRRAGGFESVRDVAARVALEARRQIRAAGALAAALGLESPENPDADEPSARDDEREAEPSPPASASPSSSPTRRISIDAHSRGLPPSRALLSAAMDLREMSLDGYLRVDDASAKTLGLFARDPHPSAFVDSKRDAGILALFDTCVTPRGRRLLRERFTRPILCVETIESRLDAVEFFARDGDAAAALDEALARASKTDVVAALAAMARNATRATRSVDDWVRLDGFLRGSVALAETAIERLSEMTSGAKDEKDAFFFREARGGGGGGGGDSSFSDDDATFTGEAACAASVRWVPGTPEAVRRLPTAARGAKQLLSIVASTIDLGGVSSGFSDGGWSYRPIVRAGVSEALDDARRVLRGLPDLLARAAREECERVPRFLRHGRGFTPDRVAIQYLPTLGFAAKLRGARLTADLAEELADWEFAFEAPDEDALESLVREDADAVFGDPNAPNDFETTRGTTSAPAFYYFTDLTRELDALVGDALTTAEDLEAEVLRDLRARTLRGARGLRQLALCVGEIDVALALARAAVAHRLARPRVVRENALRIRGGRNLHVERASGAPAVPNDADMGEPGGLPDGEAPTDDDDDDASPTEPSYGARRPRVVVITGPTQSGKSCYAYAMATIAFLAHAGSFVPAASATVGLADRVFALAASADQLATRDHRSTFTRDVDRVSRAIRAATARTILVVDEFGKGTRSADGAGLLCGFVRALAEAAEAGPRAFVTTHFAEVADETLVPRHPNLAIAHMRVVAAARGTAAFEARAAGIIDARGREDDLEDEETSAVFLHSLAPGASDSAFALRCALDAGLPREVLERIAELQRLDAARRPFGAWARWRTDDARAEGEGRTNANANANANEKGPEDAAVVAALANARLDEEGGAEAFARWIRGAGRVMG